MEISRNFRFAVRGHIRALGGGFKTGKRAIRDSFRIERRNIVRILAEYDVRFLDRDCQRVAQPLFINGVHGVPRVFRSQGTAGKTFDIEFLLIKCDLEPHRRGQRVPIIRILGIIMRQRFVAAFGGAKVEVVERVCRPVVNLFGIGGECRLTG